MHWSLAEDYEFLSLLVLTNYLVKVQLSSYSYDLWVCVIRDMPKVDCRWGFTAILCHDIFFCVIYAQAFFSIVLLERICCWCCYENVTFDGTVIRFLQRQLMHSTLNKSLGHSKQFEKCNIIIEWLKKIYGLIMLTKLIMNNNVRIFWICWSVMIATWQRVLSSSLLIFL